MLRIIYFLSFNFLVLVSCQNQDRSTGEHTTPGEKGYNFSIKNLPGSRYYYTISNETKTNIEAKGREVETDNQTEVGLLYTFTEDSAQRTKVQITYDKLHIVIKKTGEEDRVLDADNAADSYDPIDRMLNAIKGNSLHLLLDKQGNIIQTSGNKEIAAKVMETIKNEDLEFKKMVQELLNKLAGEAFIKNNLAQSFKVFPDSIVYVNSNWSKEQKEDDDIALVTKSNYTVNSITDSEVLVTISGTVVNNNAAGTNSKGYNIQAQLRGEQEGELTIDKSTGLLLLSKMTTTSKGTIRMMNTDVPLVIKSKRKVSGKKL